MTRSNPGPLEGNWAPKNLPGEGEPKNRLTSVACEVLVLAESIQTKPCHGRIGKGSLLPMDWRLRESWSAGNRVSWAHPPDRKKEHVLIYKEMR